MVYLVSYDLRKPGQDYEKVHTAIKDLSYGGIWIKPLESTWFIKSSLSSSDLYKKLKPAFDSTDHFVILEISKNYDGWLPKKTWEYIKGMFD